jgi:hypothetical protein
MVCGHSSARLPKTNKTAAEVVMFKPFIICALMAGSVHATQFWDGNKLLSSMNGDQNDRIHALGYVMGVIDTDGRRTFCAPATATLGQMHDIVKVQLDSRPELRHFNADVIVLASLGRVWPCERKKGSSS